MLSNTIHQIISTKVDSTIEADPIERKDEMIYKRKGRMNDKFKMKR